MIVFILTEETRQKMFDLGLSLACCWSLLPIYFIWGWQFMADGWNLEYNWVFQQ